MAASRNYHNLNGKMTGRSPRPFFSSFKKIGRHWLKRSRPPHVQKTSQNNFEFTIASYNVLADHLLHEHPDLYNSGDEPWIVDWSYRKHNLLQELKHANSDILCLQEVQEEHYFNWFQPRLSEQGYTGLYKKRSGDKYDGCATFFKESKFSMESFQYIDFEMANCSLMDRNNVAILVFLKPLSDSKEYSPICVGNTHLLFNTKRGDIKLAQLAYLFAEIDRLAKDRTSKTSKYLPTLLCGDFNSAPFSPLYSFVSKGKLRYEGRTKQSISGQVEVTGNALRNVFSNQIFPEDLGLTNTCKWKNESRNENSQTRHNPSNSRNMDSRVFNVDTGQYEPSQRSSAEDDSSSTSGYLQHDLSLQSSYVHYVREGPPEVTTCHNRACLTVDYIFSSVSKNEKNDRLWLSGVLGLLTEQQVKCLGNLPNALLSSDHLILMSSFVLKP